MNRSVYSVAANLCKVLPYCNILIFDRIPKSLLLTLITLHVYFVDAYLCSVLCSCECKDCTSHERDAITIQNI